MSRRRVVARATAVAVLVLLALASCAHAPSSSPAPSTAVATVIPPGSRALFFGDSWTSGYGVPGGDSYAYRAARLLSWRPIVAGQPGSGYLARLVKGSSTFPDRAAELSAERDVKVVVLQGGVNDAELPSLGGLRAAVDSTLSSLKRVYRGVPIVVLGPAQYTATPSTAIKEVDATVRTAARAADVAYISPVGEDWINPTNVGAVISSENAHPTIAGHVYLAERFVNDIRLLEQAGRLTSPRE